MEYIAWQITFDLRGRLPIARSAAEWDTIVRTLYRVLARWRLVAFCVVHDHLHVLVAVDRAAAGRAAHAVECALGWWRRPPGSVQRDTWNPPRFAPVRDRRHLGDCTRYVLANGSVETGTDLLAWRWSSAWEVLGLRPRSYPFAAGFEATTIEFVASLVAGRHDWRPEPAPPSSTPVDPPGTLTRIAAAVLGYGAGPEHVPRRERARWRALVVGLGRHRGWAPGQLAADLGVSRRSARRIAAARVPDEDLEAGLGLLGLVGVVPIAELLPLSPASPLPGEARRPRRPSAWLARR